jgi:hypothetical protein
LPPTGRSPRASGGVAQIVPGKRGGRDLPMIFGINCYRWLAVLASFAAPESRDHIHHPDAVASLAKDKASSQEYLQRSACPSAGVCHILLLRAHFNGSDSQIRVAFG